jgi:hypothetical protein
MPRFFQKRNCLNVFSNFYLINASVAICKRTASYLHYYSLFFHLFSSAAFRQPTYNKKTHFILIDKDEMGFRGTTLFERTSARSASL